MKNDIKTDFAPVKWPAEAIWEAVSPLLPGFTVEVLPEIDSTNTELMRRAKARQIEPVLLVAEKQTAGRGRLGRDWHNLAKRTDDNLPALTFSLGLPLSPLDWSGLSLAVGVSVAQSLSPTIRLKWPNDLWFNERKLAGILIETCVVGSQRYVVIGVGINITAPTANPSSLTETLRTTPAWLQEVLPQITAFEALEQIALRLVQDILVFADQGFAPFQTRFNALDVLKGRIVSIDNKQIKISADSYAQAVALGVNKMGELLIQTSQGVQMINSSEVSVKPLE
jgi:BirA family transcriptional regulator, biotin operon repressor / biotin---[acetyl-CoA-carboxylase] ligase